MMVRRIVTIGLTVGVLLGAAAGHAQVVPTRMLETPATDVLRGLLDLRQRYLEGSRRDDRELVGGVVETPEDGYRFTLGMARPGQDTVSFLVRYQPGSRLVGFWHTHGSAGPGRHLFSPQDTELVRSTGLPFYLITPSGEIRVLRPEDVAGSLARVALNPGRSRVLAPAESAVGRLLWPVPGGVPPKPVQVSLAQRDSDVHLEMVAAEEMQAAGQACGGGSGRDGRI